MCPITLPPCRSMYYYAYIPHHPCAPLPICPITTDPHLDLCIIMPHHPCTSSPMCLTAHMLHHPCPYLDLYIIVLICPISHVPHCPCIHHPSASSHLSPSRSMHYYVHMPHHPCAPLPMCPIIHVPHYPCVISCLSPRYWYYSLNTWSCTWPHMLTICPCVKMPKRCQIVKKWNI